MTKARQTATVYPLQLPVALIAALGQNRVIGKDNQLLWHLPDDLRHFKAKTLGKPIIMGRKTWDSLGRPLPGRLNIVVSRQADLPLTGAMLASSLEAAIAIADAWAKAQGADELMVIGGGQLYAQALPLAQRLYLTRVQASPAGDAWFPEFDQGQWHCELEQAVPAADGQPAHCFERWTRGGQSSAVNCTISTQ